MLQASMIPALRSSHRAWQNEKPRYEVSGNEQKLGDNTGNKGECVVTKLFCSAALEPKDCWF